MIISGLHRLFFSLNLSLLDKAPLTLCFFTFHTFTAGPFSKCHHLRGFDMAEMLRCCVNALRHCVLSLRYTDVLRCIVALSLHCCYCCVIVALSSNSIIVVLCVTLSPLVVLLHHCIASLRHCVGSWKIHYTTHAAPGLGYSVSELMCNVMFPGEEYNPWSTEVSKIHSALHSLKNH